MKLIRKLLGLKDSALPELLPNPKAVPQVSAVDDLGESFPLEQRLGAGVWVLFFFPKADTPGCTAQACSLRDAYEDLAEQGIQVIGVSSDSVASQRAFAQKYRLPFKLLADPSGEVRRAFEVGTYPLIGLSKREAFIVKDGHIVWHDASASTHQQAEDILQVLKTL